MNRFTDLRDKVLPMLRPYVKRIAVFGSFARGEETPESDIDILVELKDPEKRPRLGLGWFGLEEELSRIQDVFRGQLLSVAPDLKLPF